MFYAERGIMADVAATEAFLGAEYIGPDSIPIRDTLPLQNVDIYGQRTGLDYIKPFLVTESARTVSSPFYHVDTNNPETFSIGLEDKFLGTEIARDPQRAPIAVAEALGDMGSQMLSNLKILHGEDWTARAIAIMKSGNVATRGPQAIEDREILADLNLAFSTLLRRLNGNITQEADVFRKRIYAETDKFKKLHDMLAYSSGQRRADVPKLESESVHKITVEKALDEISPDQKRGWMFLRNLVAKLTDPKVRHAIATSVI